MHLKQLLLLFKHIQNILPIVIGFTPPANSLQTTAGWEESHFYSLAFGQTVASHTSPKVISTSPKKIFGEQD